MSININKSAKYQTVGPSLVSGLMSIVKTFRKTGRFFFNQTPIENKKRTFGF